jgi:hypothetical protein
MKSIDVPWLRTFVRVEAVFLSVVAAFFFCKSMMALPLEDMVQLAGLPPACTGTDELQYLAQQRANSQVGLLVLVGGAILSIVNSSFVVRLDDRMTRRGAIYAAIAAVIVFAASLYVSHMIQRRLYQMVSVRITQRQTLSARSGESKVVALRGNDSIFERMTNMRLDYENANGVWFDIDIEEAHVPAEAGHWGYYMTATERETQKAHVHFAIIQKDFCDTKDSSDRFLQGRPLDFLKKMLLDHYEEGEIPMVRSVAQGWLVI